MPPTFRDKGVRGAIAARRLTPGLGILLLSHYVEVACAQELLSSGRDGSRIPSEGPDRVARSTEGCEEDIAAGGTVLHAESVAQLLGKRHDPLTILPPYRRRSWP